MDGMEKESTSCRIINKLLVFGSFMICLIMICKILDSVGNIWSVSRLLYSYNEIRDYVGIRLSQFVINGVNPYTLENADNGTVPFLYQYTGLTPVMTGLLCRFTGLKIIEGNYIFCFVYIILTAYNLYLIFKKESENNIHKVILFICVLLNTSTFFSMFGNSIITFRPDASGLYLCSLIFLITNKDPKRITLLSVLSVLLLITKQFMIVFCVPLFIYLLIRDIWNDENQISASENNVRCVEKTKQIIRERIYNGYALRYLTSCIFVGGILFIVIRLMFPLYWTEIIYGQYLSTARHSMPFVNAVSGLKNFFTRYQWYLITSIGCIGALLILSRKKNYQNYSVRYFIKDHGFAVYSFLNFVCGILTCTYVARIQYDNYHYCGDLIGPSLFIIMLCLLSFLARKGERINKTANSAFLAILSLITLGVLGNFYFDKYQMEDIKDIESVYSILDEHKDDEMYIGIAATGWILKEGLTEPENIWFNDGHVEFFNTNTAGGPSFINYIFYGKEYLGRIAENYARKVNEKISRKEFSVITLEVDALVDRQMLIQNYDLQGSYKMKTDNLTFNTEVWLRKK